MSPLTLHVEHPMSGSRYGFRRVEFILTQATHSAHTPANLAAGAGSLTAARSYAPSVPHQPRGAPSYAEKFCPEIGPRCKIEYCCPNRNRTLHRAVDAFDTAMCGVSVCPCCTSFDASGLGRQRRPGDRSIAPTEYGMARPSRPGETRAGREAGRCPHHGRREAGKKVSCELRAFVACVNGAGALKTWGVVAAACARANAEQGYVHLSWQMVDSERNGEQPLKLEAA
ncbi:hypothetical protein OH76DRAFT_811667 [Lentinus brumalis]|uniref:Uncharacterized protein n=1 Tax=Lentinus brumalis TaxID=2498619 RepID=A0A371D331_9APHY|nr:hypothetical protein OH76DRAFT_811667 [Polyporus brumalis]